jgi:hypothetical protein
MKSLPQNHPSSGGVATWIQEKIADFTIKSGGIRIDISWAGLIIMALILIIVFLLKRNKRKSL